MKLSNNNYREYDIKEVYAFGTIIYKQGGTIETHLTKEEIEGFESGKVKDGDTLRIVYKSQGSTETRIIMLSDIAEVRYTIYDNQR